MQKSPPSVLLLKLSFVLSILFIDGCLPSVYETDGLQCKIITFEKDTLTGTIQSNNLSSITLEPKASHKLYSIQKIAIKNIYDFNGNDITKNIIEQSLTEKALMQSAEIQTDLYNVGIVILSIIIPILVIITISK
jgi:hypothetical protein